MKYATTLRMTGGEGFLKFWNILEESSFTELNSNGLSSIPKIIHKSWISLSVIHKERLIKFLHFSQTSNED